MWRAQFETGMGNWKPGVCLALLAALAMPSPAIPAVQGDDTALAAVLARAADYVTEFRRQLSGMVAEERYEQRARKPSADYRRSLYDEQHRELRSDFLLVRRAGEERHFEFRDVFEVDGRPVRDREERLTRLFLDESASAARQIWQIASESARYNIGFVTRTLNTPTLALLLLLSEYQPRVVFWRVTDTSARLAGGWGRAAESADL